ncbi:MAG TPA: alpha/beta fold hydrolase [Mycobacterium sp.]|nr:alpha/beta fold hydrolase [Mycobacterium sp.]HTX94831.1 alpha/beta fold hydrolase [Mycobacterium sp.]
MIRSLNGFPVTRTPATTPGSPTVLLIHGFLDDATVWDGLVDCLGGEVGAVRYDLPGFGTRIGSVGAVRGATLESLAAEAGEIVEGIDGPVIVVGQSLGAQVAELVAAQHADRVPGLVLLTPVPLGGTHLPDEVVAPFRALGGDRDAQRDVRAELSPHLGEEQLDRLADIGASVAADVVSHYVNIWNAGMSNPPAPSAFSGRVLIIRGGADAFVTERVVNAVSPRFVEADVKVMKGPAIGCTSSTPGPLRR